MALAHLTAPLRGDRRPVAAPGTCTATTVCRPLFVLDVGVVGVGATCKDKDHDVSQLLGDRAAGVGTPLGQGSVDNPPRLTPTDRPSDPIYDVCQRVSKIRHDLDHALNEAGVKYGPLRQEVVRAYNRFYAQLLAAAQWNRVPHCSLLDNDSYEILNRNQIFDRHRGLVDGAESDCKSDVISRIFGEALNRFHMAESRAVQLIEQAVSSLRHDLNPSGVLEEFRGALHSAVEANQAYLATLGSTSETRDAALDRWNDGRNSLYLAAFKLADAMYPNGSGNRKTNLIDLAQTANNDHTCGEPESPANLDPHVHEASPDSQVIGTVSALLVELDEISVDTGSAVRTILEWSAEPATSGRDSRGGDLVVPTNFANCVGLPEFGVSVIPSLDDRLRIVAAAITPAFEEFENYARRTINRLKGSALLTRPSADAMSELPQWAARTLLASNDPSSNDPLRPTAVDGQTSADALGVFGLDAQSPNRTDAAAVRPIIDSEPSVIPPMLSEVVRFWATSSVHPSKSASWHAIAESLLPASTPSPGEQLRDLNRLRGRSLFQRVTWRAEQATRPLARFVNAMRTSGSHRFTVTTSRVRSGGIRLVVGLVRALEISGGADVPGSGAYTTPPILPEPKISQIDAGDYEHPNS